MTTTAVIYDERNGKIIKEFKTFRGAKGSFKRTGLDQDPNLMCSTLEYYNKHGLVMANSLVGVKSLMTGKRVEIRRVDVGTACDPSTERYWSM